jgi:hypothetical protein
VTTVLAALGAAAWTVWLAGPLSMALQLVACLALAAVAAHRGQRRLIVWFFVGCAAAALPIAGMLAMAAATVVVRPLRAPA